MAILEVIKRFGAKPDKGKVNFFRVARVIENATEQDRTEIAVVIEQYRRGFEEMNAEMLKAIWDKDHDNIISIPMELAQPVRGWATNNKAAGFVGYGSAGGTRAVENLRLVMGELRVADVRNQVALSFYTDFEISASSTTSSTRGVPQRHA